MADYGAQDTSTTSLGANQFPISEAWTPNAGFSAVEGGPQTTDSGGKKSTPISEYVKDGGNVAQGTTTDAAVTGDTAGTLSAKLRGLSKMLADMWDSTNHWLQVKVMNANANGQSTMANSAPVAIASDQSPVAVKNGYQNNTGLSCTGVNSDLFPATDVSGYIWGALHLQTISASGTISFQGGDDNSQFPAIFAYRVDNPGYAVGTTGATTAGFTYVFPITTQYLRIRQTAGSGTSTGILRLYTTPIPLMLSSTLAYQGSTWTIQPGNTQNTTPWLVAGPNANGTQAANSAANTVIKNAPGWLYHAIVTTLGTAGLTIYDNASTNSGTPLLVIPASAAVGTIYSFPSGARAVNGITSAGVTNCPAVTFHYT